MTSSGGPPRPKLRSRARGASAPALWPAERRPDQAAPPRRLARADERQRATGGGLSTTAQYGYRAGACSRALLSFPRAVLTAPQLARPACRAWPVRARTHTARTGRRQAGGSAQCGDVRRVPLPPRSGLARARNPEFRCCSGPFTTNRGSVGRFLDARSEALHGRDKRSGRPEPMARTCQRSKRQHLERRRGGDTVRLVNGWMGGRGSRGVTPPLS